MLPQPNGWFYVEEYEGFPVIVLARCNEYLGKGAYGSYYNLRNGLGLKVFHCSYDSVAEATSSDDAVSAYKEFTNLLHANKVCPDIARKPHSMCIVAQKRAKPKSLLQKAKNFVNPYEEEIYKYIFSIGIIVEHVEGKVSEEAFKIPLIRHAFFKALKLRVAEAGMVWDDDHNYNWMWCNKRNGPVIIDWGGSWKQNYPDVKVDYHVTNLNQAIDECYEVAKYLPMLEALRPKETKANVA